MGRSVSSYSLSAGQEITINAGEATHFYYASGEGDLEISFDGVGQGTLGPSEGFTEPRAFNRVSIRSYIDQDVVVETLTGERIDNKQNDTVTIQGVAIVRHPRIKAGVRENFQYRSDGTTFARQVLSENPDRYSLTVQNTGEIFVRIFLGPRVSADLLTAYQPIEIHPGQLMEFRATDEIWVDIAPGQVGQAFLNLVEEVYEIG